VDGTLLISEVSLSHVGKNVTGVTFRLSLTSAGAVPADAAILIALGDSAPQRLSSDTVVFASPNAGAAASATLGSGTIRVQLLSGTFSAGQLITLFLPGTLTNSASVQPSRNISVSVVDNFGCVIAFNADVVFRSIVDGSLVNTSVVLNDWTAGSIGVSLSFSFTPSFGIPANSSLLITLSGSAPQIISSSRVVFESPTAGFPSASVSLVTNGVLNVFLQSGTFLSGQNIRFKLPETVTNPASPQSAKVDIATAVLDSLGVVLCESSGSMHPIVDGRLHAAINLDWRGSGAAFATLFVSIIPFCDVSQGSSFIISLMGSCPQSLSSSTVIFTSPTNGLINASASLQSGAIKVQVLSGTFSSGQLIAFKLPKTLTNAATPQPSLNNVSVSIVNSIGAIQSINRSVFFHAIHDSATIFAHRLTGYATSSVGVKAFGIFKTQGAVAGNVLSFTFPSELFVSSRCEVLFVLSHE
jgi:hypothetical protein